MIASLPMYNIPETRSATDGLWQGMRRHFRQAGIDSIPQNLDHHRASKFVWRSDDLFMSQCCGYDIVHGFKDTLQVLGTPWFMAPGCKNGEYASTIIVQEDSSFEDVLDTYGKIAVINGPESHSGMNALFSLVAPHSHNNRFFSEIKISGSHVDSLATLQNGDADVASVDCMTYELLRQYRPSALTGIRQLGFSYSAPAPPYVTRIGADPDLVTRMKDALYETFNDPTLDDIKQTLLLSNITLQDSQCYQRIKTDFQHTLRAI